MTDDDDMRPDPDALLRRVQAEADREARAHLKIFFGFAPGVGKTYAMLETARRLVDQGIGLVVGAAYTHGRQDTEALLEGLEILPPRRLSYRGQTLEELDLDAALARKPAVLILDELAHTNAPGSRHKKRWQDALELLDAGISIYTTLNVQHLESLNDVIAQITKIHVRETVPDSILDRADELELVDISVEDLLIRLREGKVYLGEQAERALQHFFQRGNLLALRELALRRTAERINVDVQAYREEHGVQSMWPTADRLLVCVGPSPSSARLVRATRRMAAGLRTEWIAAYVETSGVRAFSEGDRARLEEHLRLAESLGASVVRLSGVRVSDAVLDYARRNNVARIIAGKPTRFRLFDRLRGSLVEGLVQKSGDIDVLVISGDVEDEEANERPRRAAEPERGPAYGWAAALVLLTTGLAAAAETFLQIPDIEMLYLLEIMVTAIWFGRGPSIMAAALSVAAYDVFFVAPRYTFTVADGRYFLSFAMMFAVGILISTLALRIRRQQRDAVGREERTAALYSLSRALGSAVNLGEAAQITAKYAAEAFSAAVVVFEVGTMNEIVEIAGFPPGTDLATPDHAVARWVVEHGRPAGFSTDTLSGSRALCTPISTASAPIGVLALLPAKHEPLTADQRSFLEAICRQAAFAIERAELVEKARYSALRAKTEELRSTLLSSVSHDLRTPIASITGAATTLRDEPELEPALKSEMVETICDAADRLAHIVSNLLDMTRLASGAIALKREWVPPIELVGGALTRLRSALAGRTVTTTLSEDLPLLLVDPILMEQLLVNLLENAEKHTPRGTPIEIVGVREGEQVVLEVRDRGPGFPPGYEERAFERFQRGPRAGPHGVGLGLSICRAIADAHGGTLTAANRDGGGAMLQLRLPVPSEQPSIELEGS